MVSSSVAVFTGGAFFGRTPPSRSGFPHKRWMNHALAGKFLAGPSLRAETTASLAEPAARRGVVEARPGPLAETFVRLGNNHASTSRQPSADQTKAARVMWGRKRP